MQRSKKKINLFLSLGDLDPSVTVVCDCDVLVLQRDVLLLQRGVLTQQLAQTLLAHAEVRLALHELSHESPLLLAHGDQSCLLNGKCCSEFFWRKMCESKIFFFALLTVLCLKLCTLVHACCLSHLSEWCL